MLKNFINKILGDQNKKILKKIDPLVKQINEIETKYLETIQDQNAVLAKTSEFKERLKNGETVDDILPEAFALVKVACRHLEGKSWTVMEKEVVWNMVPYDVQLTGGIVIHRGNIAEMKTGEGKTLVCTMPVYLNALTEKGVFVVTVNEYLAKRDAQWMEGLYNYLGLSVGVTTTGMSFEDKQKAYQCDITYGTNNEFGFDYLRDNMAINKNNVVQRNLHYAIIDEVDSILIDEARTPLIISAAAESSTEKYMKYGQLVGKLEENTHYDVDEKGRNVTLNEAGIKKMEELLGIQNIYTEGGFSEVHHIEQALKAKACYQVEKDYIIRDGQVVIIDEFTGRLMQGRRYGQGLHQAIEAKEGVTIQRESKTLATISFQNYFRLFEKLSGMTGTAKTEAEEFYKIYGLDTVVIPTNKPIARQDKSDVIFKNVRGKYTAIVKTIKEVHEVGRPILVGTVSVENSEGLSRFLSQAGLKHNVLNAKNHKNEAEIVANAGQKGAITIATNMAGRGTDIKLGQGVKELGGLYVIGTERHESRRIDNQLRGRSGRQGDPGTTQFYVSMDDELMRKFGGEKIKSMMEMVGVAEDMPIETRIISRSIEGAQKKVEGHNFDIRKHLVEYDDVMNIHRNIIYTRRRNVLFHEEIKSEIYELFKEIVEALVSNYAFSPEKKDWNLKEIKEAILAITSANSSNLDAALEKETAADITEALVKHLEKNYEEREKLAEKPEQMRAIERAIYLRVIDKIWMNHIDAMTRLRGNVAFAGYAQKNPLVEYKSRGYEMFKKMLFDISHHTVNMLFKLNLEKVILNKLNQTQRQDMKAVHPSATGKSAAEVKTSRNQMRARAAQNSGATRTYTTLSKQTVAKPSGKKDNPYSTSKKKSKKKKK
jgi:preprotein translocase subunit SecA